MAGTGPGPTVPNEQPPNVGNAPQPPQPSGSEYSLQGVMRFLQLEWHRHEKQRNEWEIEKAEMKQRLARMEGEHLRSRKFEANANLRVKMLECAIVNERRRAQSHHNGDKPLDRERGYGGAASKLNEGIYKRIESGRGGIAMLSDPSKPRSATDSTSNPSHRPDDFLLDFDLESRDDESMEISRKHAEKALLEVSYITSIGATRPPIPPTQQLQARGHDPLLYPNSQSDANGSIALRQATEDGFARTQTLMSRESQGTSLALRPAISAPPISSDLIEFNPSNNGQCLPVPPPPPHTTGSHRPLNPFSRSQTAYAGTNGVYGSSVTSYPPPPQERTRSIPPSSLRGRPSTDQQQLKFIPEDIDPSNWDWSEQSEEKAQHQEQPWKPNQPFVDSETRRSDESRHSDVGSSSISASKLFGTEVHSWDFGEDLPVQKPVAFPHTSLMPSVAPPGPSSISDLMISNHSRGVDSPDSRRKSGHNTGSVFDKVIPASQQDSPAPSNQFRVRFALQGHLDVIRAVIFTGGGSTSEPEVATASDDGCIKRWIIPASYTPMGFSRPLGREGYTDFVNPTAQNSSPPDLDIHTSFTHRAHDGVVTCLAACSSDPYHAHGRAQGDGWIFSGGSDSKICVWERGRVDPKAVIDGHEDVVWALCALPAGNSITSSALSDDISDPAEKSLGLGIEGDTMTLVSGSADSTVKIWLCSAPPRPPMHSRQNSNASFGSGRRGVGGSRRHSVSSGSNYPTSPQPNFQSNHLFSYELVRTIVKDDGEGSDNREERGSRARPTCITPLGANGEHFVVSYNDASIIVYRTKTGEEVSSMQSKETYDGTPATGVNKVVCMVGNWANEADNTEAGPTGERGGLEGIIMAVHGDRYLRFYDANSGQNTYTSLAHPEAISSLSLIPVHQPQAPSSSMSHDAFGNRQSVSNAELVTSSHDSSIRLWSLETRSCTQELIAHRRCQGAGVMDVTWSRDGRWIVSCGADGIAKVFGR